MSENKGQDDLTDIKDRNLLLELNTLRAEHEKLKAEHDALKAAYQKLAKDVEEDTKADLIMKLEAATNLPRSTIQTMRTEDMIRMLESYTYLKTPVAGIRPIGDQAAQDPRLTVPNRFKYGAK